MKAESSFQSNQKKGSEQFDDEPLAGVLHPIALSEAGHPATPVTQNAAKMLLLGGHPKGLSRCR